jgi:hypothetical protein
MYKLALVQKNKFLIEYFVTVNEWKIGYWEDWCNITNCSMEIVKEEFVYITDCEYILYSCTLKTFWLNIFKRIWRKKHALIVLRRRINNLMYRNIHGKWLSIR